MKKFRRARLLSHIAVLTAALSAAPSFAQTQEKSIAEMVRKFVVVPDGRPDTDMLAKATQALAFIQRMELPDASRALNEALQLSPQNAQLHFLNGFVYHLQAKQGDAQKLDLALEGYRQALRIEPGNGIAQEFLGLAYLDQKNFDLAKQQFSEVLLTAPDSTPSIYGLMMAAYMTGDAATACAMADHYREAVAAPQADFVRSSVTVYGACGAFDKAALMRNRLSMLDGGQAALPRVDRRLAQWQALYASPAQAAKGMPALRPIKLQAGGTAAPAGPDGDRAQDAAAPASAPAAPPPGPHMVLVDVVLISSRELVNTSQGINLLTALQLQLGSVAGGLPAFSKVSSANRATGADDSLSSAITRAVTIPALSYSLNIANANNSLNEVLARPTLAATEGMPSEFFSGTNLSAGVVSTSPQGGTTIVPLEKRFGIRLAVTPAFLPGGRVQLKVEAQRTTLNPGGGSPRVAYQVEIDETAANANVVMPLGDTLVLGGLTTKSTTTNRDGVPVLQDLPLLQYLFSSKSTNEIQTSVLILITPRMPAAAAAAESGASPSERALRDKFGIAGGASNLDAVLGHMTANTLFRHFRAGDVLPQHWEKMDTTGARLRQALDFLYY